MNNFNFVLFIYFIILLQTKTSKTSLFLLANISFSDSSSEDALAGAACCTMAQQEDMVGLHGKSRVLKAFMLQWINAITRAYTSIPDKVSQVQCILHSLLLFY